MNYRKQLNEILKEFNTNPNQHNHSAIGKLYDLKDELEALCKSEQATFDTDMVLFAVYQTLELHESACAIFLKHHDENNQAHVSKIYKLVDKAKSHGNNFALKNVRAYQNDITPQAITLTLNDFLPSDDYNYGETDSKEAFFINKKISILGRYFESEDSHIDVILPKNSLPTYLPKIQELINYFSLMDKQTLIDYYNNPPDNERCFTVQATNLNADDDWFTLLELYSFQIATYGDGDNPRFFVNISMGDTYDTSHILEMEFYETKLSVIHYG